MAENLRVTPLEASIIVVNESAGFPVGHYSPEVARALHSTNWRQWYYPGSRHLRPDDFLDPFKAEELLALVGERFQPEEYFAQPFRKIDRNIHLLRFRFGFEDGMLHTLKETGERLGITPQAVRQIAERDLSNFRPIFRIFRRSLAYDH